MFRRGQTLSKQCSLCQVIYKKKKKIYIYVECICNPRCKSCFENGVENHIRHVPVIDGKIVGMISMVDVVRAIVDHQNGELKRLNQFIKGDYY